MDNTDKILLTISIASCIAIAAALGYECGRQSARKEALFSNHAYYATDIDGNAKFTWR